MVEEDIRKYLEEMNEKKGDSINRNIDISREVRTLVQKLTKEITLEGKLNIIGGLAVLACASSSGDKTLTQLALKLGMVADHT